MKLKNKKTGEIFDMNIKTIKYQNNPQGYPKHTLYNSLAELNEEWEDYEEPKDFWYIDVECGVMRDSVDPGLQDKRYPIEFMKSIGNYFETKEEAEKAVEKLKAYKRLKDKGFKVIEWTAGLGDDNYKIGEVMVGFDIDGVYDGNVPDDTEKDLDLLFGGEE